MSPTDLHSALVAKVTEYLRVAERATAGPWDHTATSLHMDGSGHYQFRPWPSGPQVFAAYFDKSINAMHIALHHPSFAILVHRQALETLNRHVPVEPKRLSELFDIPTELFDDLLAVRCLHGRERGIAVEFYPWPCPEVAGVRAIYLPTETEN
jgi:hypothetical protein